MINIHRESNRTTKIEIGFTNNYDASFNLVWKSVKFELLWFTFDLWTDTKKKKIVLKSNIDILCTSKSLIPTFNNCFSNTQCPF